MRHTWLHEYLLNLPGSTYDYQEDWQADRYRVRDKMFAMVAHNKEGEPIVTLKLIPEEGRLLREQYPDIVPGYYMNKEHWNSVKLCGDVPEDVLRRMINASHTLIFHSLPKRVQTEIGQQGAES